MLNLLAALLWVAQAAQAPSTPPTAAMPAAVAAAAYVPQRVYDTRKQAFGDFESMLADLAKADVVFVGEQHDDPNTHRLETAILEGLRRRDVPFALSLEMFERDTQSSVDDYLAGRISEDELLKGSRPWPRYATDYRPLVELAKVQSRPVVAANVPRRYASSVAKGGLAALDTLPPAERAWIAADLQCPHDAYYNRFVGEMSGHQGSSTAKPTDGKTSAPKPPTDDELKTTERYYLSQCVKDETMAEAVAAGFERNGRRLVVHVTGAFHSDFGLGTAERVRRRLGNRRVAVVTVMPVADLDTLAPAGDNLKRADYLLYTYAEPKKK